MADDKQPRWRDWDEDEDEPREWEVEREQEKSDQHRVLDGTAPLAKLVFLGIILAIVITGLVTAGRALRLHFGGG